MLEVLIKHHSARALDKQIAPTVAEDYNAITSAQRHMDVMI
jgi:hypothetical protein